LKWPRLVNRFVRGGLVFSLQCLVVFACSISGIPGIGGPSLVKIYAATANGFSFSESNGTSWDNFTTAQGLPTNVVNGLFVVNTGTFATVYAATTGGLSVTTTTGTSWSTLLPGISTNGVSVIGSGSAASIYVATSAGLQISTDGGGSWLPTAALSPTPISDVVVVGFSVYAAVSGNGTSNGLQVSLDGGNTWTQYTPTGSATNNVFGVFDDGINAYAATDAGLFVAPNTSLTTWTQVLSGVIQGVYVLGGLGGSIYAATNGGLSVSTTSGASWTTYTTANGLGSNTVRGVYAVSTTVGTFIYAATTGGISISLNGGATWKNYTTTSGLGSNTVNGVSAQ